MRVNQLTALSLAASMALISGAQAANVGGSFNVTVSLTSKCTMAALSNLAFGTYTSFQSGTQTAPSVTATLTCTRGMLAAGVTAAFDVIAAGSTAAAAATNAVGAGVLAGLQYDITAIPGVVITGAAATASSIGTADTRPFTISGTMPADQAGDASAAVTQVRTLTITY